MSREVQKVTRPNGSIEFWLGNLLLRVEAPNPFGTKWNINFSLGVHNRAWRNAHIRRRGTTWVLIELADGWVFIKEPYE